MVDEALGKGWSVVRSSGMVLRLARPMSIQGSPSRDQAHCHYCTSGVDAYAGTLKRDMRIMWSARCYKMR